MTSKTKDITWRLIKVLYFITTGLLIVNLCILIISDTQEYYYKSSLETIYTQNIAKGVIFSLLLIIGYFLVTDLIRRIISYVGNGKFEGFIQYKKINYKIIAGILIIILLIFSPLLYLNKYIKNKHQEKILNIVIENVGPLDERSKKIFPKMLDEKINIDTMISIIKKWKERCSLNICNSDMGSKIFELLEKNLSGSNIFLGEYKEIPGNPGKYIGIYATNYTDNLNNWEEKVISGEYHIFLYSDGKIYDDIKIPGLDFTYYNIDKTSITLGDTWAGGYKHDKQISLINFDDYNGDKIPNEFALQEGTFIDCGSCSTKHIMVGYKNGKIILYKYENKDGETGYWEFGLPIKNNKVSYCIGGTCQNTYYNIDENNYIFKYIKTENDF